MADEKDDILVDLPDALTETAQYELDSILEMADMGRSVDDIDASISDDIKAMFENELNLDRSEQNLVIANSRVSDSDKEETTNHNGLALVPAKRTTAEEASQTALVPTQRPSTTTEKHVMLYVAGTRYAVPLGHILEV